MRAGTAVLLVLIAFAVLATYSPALILSRVGSADLTGKLSQTWYSDLANSYSIQAEVAEVSWFAVGVCILCIVKPVRYLPQRAHRFLQYARTPGTKLKVVAVSSIVIGLVVFASAAFFDAAWASGHWSIQPFVFQNSLFWRGYYLGVTAFFSFLFAVSGFFVLKLGHGIGGALRDTLLKFVAPAVLTFELVLWIFDQGEMGLHVTQFLSGVSAFGFYLVSNVFALGATAVLVGYALLTEPGLIPRNSKMLVPAFVALVVLSSSPIAYAAAVTGSTTATVVFEGPATQPTYTIVQLSNGTFVDMLEYNLTLSYGSVTQCYLVTGLRLLPQGATVDVIHYSSLSSFRTTSLTLLGNMFTGSWCR